LSVLLTVGSENNYGTSREVIRKLVS